MTIPFLNLFKKKTEAPLPRASAPLPVAVEKASDERMSKTVLPGAKRAAAAKNLFQENGRGAVTTGGGQSPRPYSLGGGAKGNRGFDLPPAVALALEPKVERVLSLELSEVANQMPAGWIRSISEGEGRRHVLLKAAEIEKGMAGGRPSVSVVSIYRQVPEIFVRPVPDSESAQVVLPFAKVMEQFGKLQLRDDQYRDQSVPQVETPFLKVTLEDNSKFGTSMGPVETGPLPPVRVEAATAQAFAAAEPEVAFREKVLLPPLPTSVSAKSNRNTPTVVAPPEKIAPAVPTRIPFKLSPTGSDAPATERVPASSGPSVPTSVPTAPTRIPFKITPPAEDTQENGTPWLTKENFEQQGEDTAEPISFQPAKVEEAQPLTQAKISLPLKVILQALPPFQLIGDINAVPDDVRFELPFAMVEAQLPSGRVTVKPDEFAAALPEKYKSVFSSKEIAAPVSIPLQEVLKNLPSTTLRMRDDQVEQEKGVDFATPFSAKAEEDARRFNLSTTTEMKPLRGMVSKKAKAAAKLTPVAEPAVTEAPTAAPPAPEKSPARSPLQIAFNTDDELDARAVVAHVEAIAGVKACTIMFGDGLSLAGSLPESYQADGLCAVAPSLLQKTESHLATTKFGALRSMTLSCVDGAVTLFMHENLCLAALHATDELSAEGRGLLARVVQELSKKYSHPV